MKEYLESASVFIQLYSFYLAPIVGTILTYYLLFYTRLWPFVLAYLAFVYVDRDTPSKDGRSRGFLRRLFLWKQFIDYFPQELVKTADLDPSHNHLLCFFPHGLMTTAALSHFANDTSRANEFFPGNTFIGLTLNLNFYVPFFRELAMGYGLRSVSKESIMHQLRGTKGTAVVIYPGGSAEAAKSEPGKYRVAIKNRKGFVKLAMQTGTNLVPVIAFGEVDLFNHEIPAEGSIAEKVQTYIRKKTGVALGKCSGRGFLGLLPLRKRVTTVVGKPLIVKKNENPTIEEIDKLHSEFLESLVTLFEQHKEKYITDPGSTFLSIED